MKEPYICTYIQWIITGIHDYEAGIHQLWPMDQIRQYVSWVKNAVYSSEWLEINRETINISWPLKFIWNSNFNVHKQSFIRTQPHSLWLLIVYGCFHTTVAGLNSCNQQTLWGPQNLKYLLGGSWKKSLPSCYRWNKVSDWQRNHWREKKLSLGKSL